MNIFQLRNVIFNDLKTPLGYLTHRGFVAGQTPDSVRVYGNTAYFYVNGQDWSTLTPPSTVGVSNVNTFKGEEHTCSVTTDQEWIVQVTQQLKTGAKMVYDQGVLPLATKNHSCFESFWEACSKRTNVIRLLEYAFTKRGHKKQYINMYNDAGEITGHFDLVSGSTVRASVRWTLNVSTDADRVHVGFRPSFGGGIHVLEMAGAPPNIRNPWIFKHFNFDTFKPVMYDSFVVKCPAMMVLEQFGTSFKVDLSKRSEFKQAMDIFHEKAGSPPWDGTIHLNTSKPVVAGVAVLATVYAIRNKDHINWHTEKFFLLRRNHQTKNEETAAKTVAKTVAKMVGTKRDADSMDNSFVSKTKRQYTQCDIRAHMAT